MSQDISSNNQRIAKNTMMLYIRMGISMIVGLYTSRVVLQTLGVEDFGIYGLVGGVVAFMSFLNASMSGATSRFLMYELGVGSESILKETFVSSFWVHLIIAAIVFLVAETVGLWFLFNKLVIPETRINAAFWVYQFSIAAAIVNITQVPYNASIISHENMDIYAFVEIANVVLKLAIVYLLTLLPVDKLILYSALYFTVSFGIAICYRKFCLKHYPETHLCLLWNKERITKMLTFCGWDLYGNFGYSVKYQGRSFLLNMFFGVTINAAVSVASSVTGMVMGFTGAISQAFRPQIIKQYAQGNVNQMQILATNSMKFTLLLMTLMAVPLIIEADYILKLWLGIVPEYTAVFCRLILIVNCVNVGVSVINMIIHATGNVKLLSFISGTLCWLLLPIIYLCFSLGLNEASAYIVDIILCSCTFVINLYIAKSNIKDLNMKMFYKSIFIVIAAILPGIIIATTIYFQLDETFGRLILVTLSFSLLTGVITYLLLIDASSRKIVNNKVRAMICRNFRWF